MRPSRTKHSSAFRAQVTTKTSIPGWKKLVAITATVTTYSLLNYFIRVHLPGISNVDIRPQIVLIFLAGYLYGPWFGFIAGFAGNLCTDLLFGYGLTYLPSWTIGNGLIGALMGLFPYRKHLQLERIGQMVLMVLVLILVNVLSLAYAASMESIRGSHLPSAINFHYFYLPALLSNVLGTLILFPAILLFLGRLKKNFPIKVDRAAGQRKSTGKNSIGAKTFVVPLSRRMGENTRSEPGNNRRWFFHRSQERV